MSNQTPTPQSADEAADICAADEASYGKFVESLTAAPNTYNLSDEVVFGLLEALHRLTPASLELDHFKRALTYGEKLRINPHSNVHRQFSIPNVIQQARDNIHHQIELTAAADRHLLLIHGILGKITEAIELAPILCQLLIGNGLVDEINLKEELGDDEFYSSLVRTALNMPRKTILKSNVKKLHKRYKGKQFSREEAVNRNLDTEREALS